MSSPVVRVAAPSRLHFGLLSFGHADKAAPRRQFGGVGAMIARPGIRLAISVADQLTAAGPLSRRALEFARRWSAFHTLADLLCCRIEIESAPRQHTGLGVGTQLALAVASGLNAFHRLPTPSPAELAISVGRGLRSAVGLYGFSQGGLIVERGKLPGEKIAPLDCRLDLPEQWRFVLVRPCDDYGPADAEGLSGATERSAFAELPPVPRETTARLVEELRQRMVPAAARGDFESFSDSVTAFGRLAGSCFAELQGGPYNGPRLNRLVETIQSLGVRGVGQSSWGPTIFALLPDEQKAEEFVARLSETSTEPCETIIAPPDNRGVRIEMEG